MSIPAIRGMALLPAATAIQADPQRYGPHVPEHLRHYLSMEVHKLEWYPTADMLALLHVIAAVEFPDQSLEQQFHYFGNVGAHRDLGGTQEMVARRLRTDTAGAWEGTVRKGLDYGSALRCVFGMHQLYFDAGEFELRRQSERVVTARKVGFPAVRELCQMTLGYACATAEMIELPATVEMCHCRAYGDDDCQYTVRFRDDTDVSALVDIAPP